MHASKIAPFVLLFSSMFLAMTNADIILNAQERTATAVGDTGTATQSAADFTNFAADMVSGTQTSSQQNYWGHATQNSSLSTTHFSCVGVVEGFHGLGNAASIFHITFTANTPQQYTFEGFAHRAGLNGARLDASLTGPGGAVFSGTAFQGQDLSFNGTLAAGQYILDARIVASGVSTSATMGGDYGVDMTFVPVPSTAIVAAAALGLTRRKR